MKARPGVWFSNGCTLTLLSSLSSWHSFHTKEQASGGVRKQISFIKLSAVFEHSIYLMQLSSLITTLDTLSHSLRQLVLLLLKTCPRIEPSLRRPKDHMTCTISSPTRRVTLWYSLLLTRKRISGATRTKTVTAWNTTSLKTFGTGSASLLWIPKLSQKSSPFPRSATLTPSHMTECTASTRPSTAKWGTSSPALLAPMLPSYADQLALGVLPIPRDGPVVVALEEPKN